jgi:hypothetical protein
MGGRGLVGDVVGEGVLGVVVFNGTGHYVSSAGERAGA